MNKIALFFVLLSLMLPHYLAAQIGVADPVTGNASIDFYGQVVDQDGNPLADAKVDVDIFSEHLSSPTQLIDVHGRSVLTTDSNGQFGVTDKQGHSIEIESIKKEGYRLSDKTTRLYPYSWSANIFHPDSSKPVIFKMWKTKGMERLIQPRAWNGNISCDGRTNRFDLLTGHSTPDGALEITCSRLPLDRIPREGKPFDYTFEIAIRGGGVQPTSDEFTYFAPETDYSPRFIEKKKVGEPGWRGRFTQEFYIKTAEGHYGRITVDWYVSQTNPTHLDWNCSINPSGSRNLER